MCPVHYDKQRSIPKRLCWNASPASKPSMSWPRYSKWYVEIIRRHGRWLLKSSKKATIGRPFKETALSTWKSTKCQKFGPLHHAKPETLHSLISPWSFAICGMDIIDPFALGKWQTKFLLVGIDYFTKWIEVEPLASISTKNVQNFVWRSIVCVGSASLTLTR